MKPDIRLDYDFAREFTHQKPREQEKPLPERDRTPDRDKHPVRYRMAGHKVSEQQLAVMTDIGRFRSVSTRDLAGRYYAGELPAAGREIENLAAQGLITRHGSRERGGQNWH